MSRLIKQQFVVASVFVMFFFLGVFISTVAVAVFDTENSLLAQYWEKYYDGGTTILSDKQKSNRSVKPVVMTPSVKAEKAKESVKPAVRANRYSPHKKKVRITIDPLQPDLSQR